ncbi:MAG: hypothetical protein CM1200mP41_23780 [Gammaproteobacteria bacterium]|nr:MAG: hypothetical protein CM1200mP41_23780 [Gammaproteobacteria bacterium]
MLRYSPKERFAISQFPVAGDQITNDIAVALRTPTSAAEEIKKKFGCALAQLANDGELIDTPSVGDRAPPSIWAPSTLTGVIEPRVEEFLSWCRLKFDAADSKNYLEQE